MAKKFFLSALIVIALCSVSLASTPVPPSKGQWAYVLEGYTQLYSKPDSGSSSQEIEVPGKWISVPSATRDSNNYLWYSVSINGKKGWIPQNGVRLKMGGKSKLVSSIYRNNYVKARNRIMKKSQGWEVSDYEDAIAYTSPTSEFRIRRSGKNIEDVYFLSDDGSVCESFLGFDIIRMRQSELRKKIGTPTTRESPDDDIDVSILCFELADRNLTLSITLRRDDGEDEGRVESVELYRGRAGEPED